jgi:8-oxo-dGTP pyrophosphatase MutT (NUDIX family)
MSGSKPVLFNFAKHPSNSSFAVTSQDYLLNHPNSEFSYLATGALVFDNPKAKDPRVLLLQRSASDSWPNRWEIPGGACDDDDESILHGLARELWEESGLTATKIGPVLGAVQRFTSRSGKQIGKFIFFVEVQKGTEHEDLEVKLSPDEHQRYVWANQDEVKALKVGDIKLEFTTSDVEATVLEAFKLREGVY